MPGTVIPNIPPQFFDDDGVPVAGGLVFTYAAGTSTKQATYKDEPLTAVNTNPIILDSAGRASIFFTPTSYKVILSPSTDTDPPTNSIWSRDNISAIPAFNVNLEVTAVAGEALAENEVAYLSAGDGGKTAGKWYLADADNDYSSNTAASIGIAPAAIAQDASGSIRLSGRVTGLAGLTIGSVYYVSATAGALTSTAPTNSRAMGIADSATALVLVPAEGANETTGPLPAISGAALTGVNKYSDSVVADVGNVGAGEDTLHSFSFGAGALDTNGDMVRVLFWGKTANNANAKTLGIRIDDTATDTTILNASLTVSQAGHWMCGAAVIRATSTTARSGAQVCVGPTDAQTTASVGNIGKDFSCLWANAVEVRLVGTATTTDDITVEGGQIQLNSV